MLAILAQLLYLGLMKKKNELPILDPNELNFSVRIFSELVFWALNREGVVPEKCKISKFMNQTASSVLRFYQKEWKIFCMLVEAEITASFRDVCWMIARDNLNPEETKARIATAISPYFFPFDAKEKDTLLSKLVLTKIQIKEEFEGPAKAGAYMASMLFNSFDDPKYHLSESTFFQGRWLKRKSLQENFYSKVRPYVSFRRAEFEDWILKITMPEFLQARKQGDKPKN